ncbi:NADP-dependent oxidoreductase [Streptomyces mutabilis]|uniref:MDR family NADP-dependent oxidoreductase n=1 Tax=Streptomyces mutabilis TaxID=67332 RepID=UPI0022BA4AF2|nr:NADP-dependent oxidoreductase [Streptomyces mutabilis]MCZ9354696.1 NADP-dependent oxidoreductase [Streptomyces mutabilis]
MNSTRYRHTPVREVRLASRPVGEPTPENFQLVTTQVPEPGEGQIVVRNTWMSVDPYMRGRMDDAPSYIPPFALGAALDGGAVGEVIASRAGSVPVGATVSHFLGRREHAVLDATAATVADTALAPAPAYLGPLGTTGLTAYAALTRTAPVREGDVVFVSAAAGAVGSVAGQLARQPGASRVIGSAGGPRKTRTLLDAFGFDTAIDHRQGGLPNSSRKPPPTASTSTSTPWAAATWRRRSVRCAPAGASPWSARSRCWSGCETATARRAWRGAAPPSVTGYLRTAAPGAGEPFQFRRDHGRASSSVPDT